MAGRFEGALNQSITVNTVNFNQCQIHLTIPVLMKILIMLKLINDTTKGGLTIF